MVPLKNFELVARATASLSMPVHINIAGAVEDQGYWKRCESLLSGAGSNVTIENHGHLTNADLRNLMRKSDVMALPTRGENFGHVIAEALSVGCPVLVPDTTLWTQLIRDGGGSVIDSEDPEPMVEALEVLYRMSPDDRNAQRTRVIHLYRRWWDTSQQADGSLFSTALALQIRSAMPPVGWTSEPERSDLAGS